MVPWVAWLSLRHGHPLACLAANPGIAHGGGLVDESKSAIAAGFVGTGTSTGRHAHTRLIAPNGTPEARAAQALDLIASDQALGGFPVILKPDAGQRGHGVRLARTPDDVHRYFLHTARAVIVQEYHPGPEECGIFWIRRDVQAVTPSATTATRGNSNREGFIFSITRKQFPVIQGDGLRTLAALIRDHPRFRRQAHVFETRLGPTALARVPAAGEAVRLGEAGNHAQGCRFSDGLDLLTPALEDAIDHIARSFRGDRGLPIDFGRFDIRYESDDALRRGEGFRIVEFNGTSAEATALYDPDRGLRFAYGLFFRQWAHLYRLGAARRRAGGYTPAVREVWGWLRHHQRTRDGSVVSD